jgi:PAS domain S-box-containing protein
VNVGVLLGVGVMDDVGVMLGVSVIVGVCVWVGVWLGVGVFVLVAVGLAVGVFVGVWEGVTVDVIVTIGVGVGLFAQANPPAKPTTTNSNPIGMSTNTPRRMEMILYEKMIRRNGGISEQGHSSLFFPLTHRPIDPVTFANFHPTPKCSILRVLITYKCNTPSPERSIIMKDIQNDDCHPGALCQAIVDNSPVAITTFDKDGSITSWNSAAEILFGYPAGATLGHPIAEMIKRVEGDQAHEVNLVQLIDEGGRVQFSAQHLRKELPPIDVELIGAPIQEDGKTVGYLAISSDVSEFVRINEELRSQKEYLEAIFENSPTAFVSVDFEGDVVSWNPVAEKLFGYTQQEVTGVNIDDLLAKDPSIREEAQRNTRQVLGHGRIQMSTKRTHKDGSLVEVELLAVPVVVSGEIVGFIAIYHDISELKSIERELRFQKEYYEALFVNSPVAVVTADLDGNTMSWNPSAEKLFGYSEEEVIGVFLDDIIANHPSVYEEAVGYTRQVMQEGLAQGTARRTRKNGDFVDVELLSMPVTVANERVGYITIYHNISELKEVERELRRQKEYYEALFVNSPVAVVTGDLNSTIISWNPQAEKLFGHKASEVIGKNLDDLVATTPEMREEALGYVDHVLNVGLVKATTQRTRKDGTYVNVELLALPVIVAGEKVGFIAIYHDISELKKVERELRKQKEYYESLFINSPVAFITADLDENIISWNPLAEELFGYTAGEVIGKKLDAIVANDPVVRDEAIERSKQVIAQGRVHVTTKRTRKDGSLVDVELLGVPVIVGGEAVGFIGIYNDLTERIKTERELRRQKEYYESLFVNNPVAVVTADVNGIIVSWNPVAETLFGYTEAEVVGRNVDDIVANHPSLREEAEKNTQQVLEVGRVKKTTERTRKDGSFVEVELLALPIIVSGEKIGFFAIYYDLSELKNIERELRHQKEYYEALFTNNPVAVVTTDMDINVVSWNPATEMLFGYTAEEAIGKNLDDLVAKDQRVRGEALRYSRELTSSRTDHVQLTTQRNRKDGSLVDVETIGVPVFVGDQQVGFIGLYYDITELKNIERELRHQKAYFEATLENSPVAQMNADLAENVVYWNKASEQLFGFPKEEALGQKIDDLVARHEQIRAEALEYTKQLYEVGQVHLTSKRSRKDGSLVDVEASAAPVYVEGEVVGFTAAYHDIGPLLEARRQAEAANQAKSEFLARMSHELRTPMNAIIGFTRIVKRKGTSALPEKQLDNLDKVLTSADHLLGLINDVLDLSKIEAGRIEVEPTTFKIEPLIKLCLSTTQALVRPGLVKLEKVIDGMIEPVYSDEDKVKQILLNLLSNAAKFTHEGKITLTAESEKDSLFLSVADTGIGISEGSLERIFEEFQQADAKTTREYGGTGLGLTISQRLAHLIGGEITAESTEGEGSTFTLRIPLMYIETTGQDNYNSTNE